MVTKLLRLSQITNGGPGSGESEGHEFRGNQWSGKSLGLTAKKGDNYWDISLVSDNDTFSKYQELRGNAKELKGQEKSAVNDYTKGKSNYKSLNSYLRNDEDFSPLSAISDMPEDLQNRFRNDYDKQIKGMDLAIEKSIPLPDNTILWRGVGPVNSDTVNSLNIGDICADKAFQSYSLSPEVASLYTGDSNTMKPEELHVVIRADASNVKGIIGSTIQREIIIGRNTQWKVTQIDYIKGKGESGNEHTFKVISVVPGDKP
jgi:hypothetical protein